MAALHNCVLQLDDGLASAGGLHPDLGLDHLAWAGPVVAVLPVAGQAGGEVPRRALAARVLTRPAASDTVIRRS